MGGGNWRAKRSKLSVYVATKTPVLCRPAKCCSRHHPKQRSAPNQNPVSLTPECYIRASDSRADLQSQRCLGSVYTCRVARFCCPGTAPRLAGSFAAMLSRESQEVQRKQLYFDPTPFNKNAHGSMRVRRR